jgi:hypothetical protein
MEWQSWLNYPWPSRSPDFTLFNFKMDGFAKDAISVPSINSIEAFRISTGVIHQRELDRT